MTTLLIKHELVVTVDSQRRIIKDGAVFVEGDRIAALGKSAELENRPADRVIDAQGKIVMPG